MSEFSCPMDMIYRGSSSNSHNSEHCAVRCVGMMIVARRNSQNENQAKQKTMKKLFIAAAMAVFAMTASAQEDMSEDNFFGVGKVKLNNSDYEFRSDVQAEKYNYPHLMNKRSEHLDVIPCPVGNDLEGTYLYSVRNHGAAWYLQMVGSYVANRFAGGIGAGVGYEHRKWGLDGMLNLQYAKPDRASDDRRAFLQERGEFSMYFKPVEWKNNHIGLKAGATIGVQLSQYVKNDGWVSTTTETTGDGKVTTTSVTTENINLRDFVSFGDVFVKLYGRKAFSPWGWYFGIAGGMMQNIILNNNKFYPEVRVTAGIELRFVRNGTYNYPAMKRLNLTESQVWDMRHGSKPYQKPGERK